MGCRGEFRVKNLLFSCNDEERDLFFRTQHSKSRTIYLVYRICVWMYHFGWFLAGYIHHSIFVPVNVVVGYRYLTRWGHFINMVYFTIALIYSIIGFVRRNKASTEPESRPMLILRSMKWMLHSIGQSTSLIITILYWAFVFNQASSGNAPSAFNVDTHAVQLILYLIEIFVVGFPMRLLHAIYPALFGLVYVIATVIIHAAGDDSAIYTFVDWENQPGRAAGIAIAISICGSVLCHALMFGLYRLRVFLAGRCCPSSSGVKSNLSSVNPAFEADGP